MPAVYADLERIGSFHGDDPARSMRVRAAIREAISVLARHPRIGRIVDGDADVRELVISHGKDGFIALYRYIARPAHVRILRVRHQRELGYPER